MFGFQFVECAAQRLGFVDTDTPGEILTTDNLEQALLRAGSKAGNKVADAALAALEMADFLREIRRAGEA